MSSSAHQLPPNPDLRHLKDQAKDLLRSGQATHLAEAHFRIARSYGFDSWPKLKAHVDGTNVRRLVDAVRAGDIADATAILDARPELVKTMSVQPPRGSGRVRLLRIPGIDLQPCGGTHVRNIGEIGAIRVVKIKNEGKRNKRVEIVLNDPHARG